MKVDIQRINTYKDERFSEHILKQHGAYIINDNIPCEIEILNQKEAIIYGNVEKYYDSLIEEFRFHAEHICKFYNEKHQLIKEYEPMKTFAIKMEDIQPAQSYVDREKIDAVKSFITSEQDIIIPLVKQGERYISLDGHTRLAVAAELGYHEVLGYTTQAGDYIFSFAKEAQKRNIFTPYDMKQISHEEYVILWHQFCDAFFGRN